MNKQDAAGFKQDYRMEQQRYFTTQDIAEDRLDAMKTIMQMPEDIIKSISRLLPYVNENELVSAHHALEEIIADQLAAYWRENWDVGVSIEYPREIPSFVKEEL
jgi:hypothetical protein